MPHDQSPAGKSRPADWFAKSLNIIALFMGKRLNEIDQGKPIGKLSLHELEGMAYDVICQYENLREVERQRLGISLFDEYSLNLMGYGLLPIIPELSNPNGTCCICGMQARGFIVQFNPNVHLKPVKGAAEIRTKQGPFPQYACCGLPCSSAALAIIIRCKGIMPANTITQMEKKAIEDAKAPLFEGLTEIGAADAFNDQPAQNMEFLIYKIWCALRASMQRQSAAGEIPF
jgi:hypothetical protein